MTCPSIPQELDRITAFKKNRFHYEVSRWDIARGFCLARMAEVPELVIVTSKVEEDTLARNLLGTIFTASLQHFYRTFMTAQSAPAILCSVGQDKARGRSCR